MKKNLTRIISVFLCLLLLVQLTAVTAFAVPRANVYDYKLETLRSALMSDEETLKAVKELGSAIAIVSVSDGTSKAKVFYGTSSQIAFALENVFEKVKKSGVTPKWVRLDVAVSKEAKSYAEFKQENMGFRTCIMRSCVAFNNYFGTLLTEGQINAACMIDNETGCLDLQKVNAELSAMGKKRLTEIPDTLYLLKTQGYFTDNGEYAQKLLNGTYMTTGRRSVTLSREYLENLSFKSSAYLASICGEDGRFVYGFDPIDNTELEGYNIIRHAGTVWNLVMQYEMTRNEALVPVIESALDFLEKFAVYKDEKTAFILDGRTLNLGGNGLSMLAFCAYAETFGSTKYDKLIKALANGVIFMQKSDGSFSHSLDRDTYKVDQDYIIIYYDGEAVYGMLRAYGLFKDRRYLTCARRAANNFIDNHYEKEHSHWIAYCFNELTKYDQSEKYFEFGLKNVNEDDYTKKACGTITSAHAMNETLGATFELYDRLVTGGYKCDYLERFDAGMFMKAIKRRTFYGLNYFMFPECAMYFKDPQLVLNSFAIREDRFRIRIDDIQHFMDGYYLYWKNFDKLAGYEEK